MQAIARAFYKIDSQGCGWSENYPMTAVDLTAAMARLQALNNSRMTLFAPDVTCVYLSVSDIIVFRDVLTEEPATNVGSYIPAPPTTTSPGYNRILCRWQGTAVARANHYFGGIPFDVLTAGIATPPAPWSVLFAAYKGVIISDATIRSRNRTPPPQFIDTPVTAVFRERFTHRPVGRPFGQPRGRRIVA